MSKQQQRPVYLNLFKIKLPITGLVSIAHRISGVILVLILPVGIYLLQESLQSKQGFEWVGHFFSQTGVRVIMLLGIWALAHHLFTGIRFLLIDMHIGVDLKTARISAWLVAFGAFLVTLFVAMRWFL